MADIDWDKVAASIKSAGFTVEEVLAAFERARVELQTKETLPEVTRRISDERNESSIFIIEIRKTGELALDVQGHGTFNNKTATKVNVLTALTFALRNFADFYQAELDREPGEKPNPKASLSDSFKSHGIKHVIYDPLALMEATRSVLAILQRHSQRRVAALGVAGLIVWMQAELAGDTIDNTIELMRIFIDNMKRDPKIKARA